jgi:hypothetical protein
MVNLALSHSQILDFFGSDNDQEKCNNYDARAQRYKTFCNRNLQIFTIS